jgi:Ankyrin repeat
MDEFLIACELHSVERLQAVLDGGLDANASVRGKRPVDWLLEMYTRSDRFPACLRLLLERGATLDDPWLLPVLLDEAETLEAAIRADRSLLEHRATLTSAFTPLVGVTLLHVAAEYGHVNAARVLVAEGADVNAGASLNEDGLGGHTPIFHTVNSHANRSAPVMRLLLAAGAAADVRLQGLTWGRGFEWETTLFDVTPVSYAQAGLLPQMHRDERDVYDNVRTLLQAAGRAVPPLANVPNRYLGGARRPAAGR